ncbi:MAG TPA: S41 family peptidase [Anaerolineae bacterium]|nr:S41 family peptidase [Anaerolineae bacterium]
MDQEYNASTTYVLIAIIILLLMMILSTGCFASGFAVGKEVFEPPAVTTPASATDENIRMLSQPENFSIFWDALKLLDENYDGDVPHGRDVTYAAIQGLLDHVEGCDQDSSPPETILQITDAEDPKDAPDNFSFFWSTVNQLYRDCPAIMPEDPAELTYWAANGVIDRLGDKYTMLLPPRVAEDFRIDMESSFEGIGALVEPADEEERTGVRIVHPFENSPADKAGLRPGDEIIAVDGQDVTEMLLDQAVSLIRGPAGSQVVLTVKRGDDPPFDVTITRSRVEIPVIESKMLDDNILYVKLYEFSDPSKDKMEHALKQGLKDGAKAIVFDLRGNPGGRLDRAIQIASMFIEEGVIVKETGQRNMDHMATGDLIVPEDIPVVVLVDGGSASASEIVAGALQDYKRAILIGEQTFGKGSVQTLFDLKDGSMLRVTSAHWYTPKGRQINSVGLRPNLVVSPSLDINEDLQLDAAIDYLKKQLTK